MSEPLPDRANQDPPPGPQQRIEIFADHLGPPSSFRRYALKTLSRCKHSVRRADAIPPDQRLTSERRNAAYCVFDIFKIDQSASYRGLIAAPDWGAGQGKRCQ